MKTNEKDMTRADALSHIAFVLHEISAHVIGFERMKDDYNTCPDFGLIFQEVNTGNRCDFVILDGYFFKATKLCIPCTSLREFLVWELHVSGLAGYLRKDKTIALVDDRFYWPSLKRDVVRIVSQCRTY
ncbi:uncharacterized protein LOC131183210 [Hevea brasiliensis]|uniref:uncharacterized protein LOC131183210 n=1 Tax=Hevea brasiliensis TaxID=3981 RepID=UPI0025DB4C9F|nr:uncharacterized protein LOC131183210 [Hevea brasiliensis]